MYKKYYKKWIKKKKIILFTIYIHVCICNMYVYTYMIDDDERVVWNKNVNLLWSSKMVALSDELLANRYDVWLCMVVGRRRIRRRRGREWEWAIDKDRGSARVAFKRGLDVFSQWGD